MINMASTLFKCDSSRLHPALVHEAKLSRRTFSPLNIRSSFPRTNGNRTLTTTSNRGGIIGQKGQKGSSSKSAFSVHRSTRLSASISNPKIITYDTTTTNYGGDINPTTGKFTCSIPGLYNFSYSIKTYPNKEVGVHLIKNEEGFHGLYKEPCGRQIVLSQNVIVPLRYGDEVWLQLYAVFDDLAEMGGSNSNLNTFSGYLILAT